MLEPMFFFWSLVMYNSDLCCNPMWDGLSVCHDTENENKLGGNCYSSPDFSWRGVKKNPDEEWELRKARGEREERMAGRSDGGRTRRREKDKRLLSDSQARSC